MKKFKPYAIYSINHHGSGYVVLCYADGRLISRQHAITKDQAISACDRWLENPVIVENLEVEEI